MNREIKFRVWDGEKMISPDYIARDGSAWWKEHSIPTRSEQVMQFTGLKDCKGKDIYEGDVLKITSWDDSQTNVPKPRWKIGAVEFRSGAFRVHAYLVCELAHFAKVIGNIHENPELLEGKE